MTRWNTITKKDAEKYGIEKPEETKRKYNNKKPEIDGVTFDSQKEANYYVKLKLMKRAGKVERFELQPEFVLLDPKNDRVTGRGIKYRADFKIVWEDGLEEIIDVKGYKTNIYKLKKKLLLARYPEINFREVIDVG